MNALRRSSHRPNRTERAINDWKTHFIADLATVAAWNKLVYQGELTINHLRTYALYLAISAYEGVIGKKYDSVSHPIYPRAV